MLTQRARNASAALAKLVRPPVASYSAEHPRSIMTSTAESRTETAIEPRQPIRFEKNRNTGYRRARLAREICHAAAGTVSPEWQSTHTATCWLLR